MRMLLVEDDDLKLSDVMTYLNTLDIEFEINKAKSMATAVNMAVEDAYDLILLDMTIPNFDQSEGHDGGASYKNGGELIVRELLDENILFKCAIITQYETFNNETIEQISQRVHQLCGGNYYGYVKYSTMDEEWKEKLKKIIEDVKSIID